MKISLSQETYLIPMLFCLKYCILSIYDAGKLAIVHSAPNAAPRSQHLKNFFVQTQDAVKIQTTTTEDMRLNSSNPKTTAEFTTTQTQILDYPIVEQNGREHLIPVDLHIFCET